MKKLIGLFIVCALSFSAFAGAISAPTAYGPQYWEADTSWTTDDTISGVDSLSILSAYEFKPGYEYALRLKISTPAADSLHFKTIGLGIDGTTEFEVEITDTLGASASTVSFSLPIGQTILTNKATVKALGWIAAKDRVLTRIELWRRQLVQRVYRR